MDFIITNLGLIITIVSALSALTGWWVTKVRKGYGFERDINHLKRDYQALSENFAHLNTELERRLDQVEKDLAIIRAVNQALIAQGPRGRIEPMAPGTDG